MQRLILQSFSPSCNLAEAISSKLKVLEQKSVKEKMIVFGGLLLACILVLVPLSLSLHDSLETSGFTNYVSLLFSDFSAVAPSFKEFGLSLFETIPVFLLALASVLLSLFLWSLISLSGLVIRKRAQ